MAKGIQKNYTLNCSHKCPCTFPHSYALLRHLVFEKKQFDVKQITFSTAQGTKKETKPVADPKSTSKINTRSHVEHISKFCLCQQLFAFKNFCLETRLSNILIKTTNATKFIKTVLESTYKALLGTSNLVAPTRPVFLLRAIEFQQLLMFRLL